MSDLSTDRYLLLVNSEQNEEFHEWWRTVHIPEVVAKVPGIISGQVFRLSPVRVSATDTDLRQYLAVYEIDGDPAGVVSALHKAHDDGELSPAPAGRGTSTSAVFEPVIARLTPPAIDALRRVT